MQKRLIATVIAAALSTPAFADNANVNVYGKAFLTFDQVNAGAGATSVNRVNTNASRFGVKGDEDLGGGLKAVYQFEVQVDADGNAGNGLGNGSRNSFVGLQGGFGKVVLGVNDTPFKVSHNKIELFDNTTNWSATNVIGRSEGKNFNSRQKNMVQYWSPKMGGASLAFMYSPDESQTGTKNAAIYSLSGTLEMDALYAALAYESRKDVTPGTTDSATRLVAKYDFGGAWIGAMAENIKTNTSTTTSVTGNNYEISGNVGLGGGSSLGLTYTKAGSTAAAGTAANDVSQVAVKYAYKFSKRTELFAAYASKKTNGAASVTATALGFGMMHSF